MVLVYESCGMIMEYDTLQRKMLSSEQKFAYICLYFIDQTPNSYPIQL